MHGRRGSRPAAQAAGAAGPGPATACATLAGVVLQRAAAAPDRVLLRRRAPDGRWQDVTAAAFRAEVEALARGLIAAGIEPGDRVALISRTRYEWTLIDFAIWTAGAVTVPVYETSSAAQVRWILEDSQAQAVFAETSGHQAIISELRAHLPGLAYTWPVDGAGALAAAGRQVSDAELARRRDSRSGADLATIVYTSGTTGEPKGCALTHANLLADVRSAISVLPEIFTAPGCSTLLFLPLAHVFARIIEIGILEAGAVLGHWPDLGTVADGLAEFRPTFLLAVPRVFEKAYDAAQQQAAASPARARLFAASAQTAIAWSRAAGETPGGAAGGGTAPGGRARAGLRLRHRVFDVLVYRRLRAALGGQVRYAICGGAPLGERLGHFFRGAGITVLEGYGLTEASAGVTLNRPGRNRIGTVGQALPGTGVRISGDGEILVSGPTVFGGYWRDRAATDEVLGPGGWLRTGDLGTLDQAGFLRVTGRRKELIVTASGKNVAPSVLEDQIRAHPLVSQCMVVGDGRPYIACLVTLDQEALQDWTRRHGRPAGAGPGDLSAGRQLVAEIQLAVDAANQAVSRAESIRRFAILGVDFTEAAGHLTPSAKVRRATVARDFAAEIEALYRTGTGAGPAPGRG